MRCPDVATGPRLPAHPSGRVRTRTSCSASLVLVITVLVVAPAGGQIPALRPERSAPDLVLEREDWLGFEPMSLEDLLAHFAGIVVARRGGLGSLAYVNLAGSVPGRVRLVVDGIEYDEPEFAWPRLFTIQVSGIERIELHRTEDPARLEIWTRQPESKAPVTEIDLARGDLVTRTRRVQLLTPRRSWRVGWRYEELLRGPHDFRAGPGSSTPDQLGRYDGRGVWLEAELVRPSGESLLLRFHDFADNAHGSFQNSEDFTSTSRVLNSIRWDRAVGRTGMLLDVSYLAWDRNRQVDGRLQKVTEARGRLALDLDLPGNDAWSSEFRIRAADVKGESSEDASRVRNAHRRYDVGVRAARSGRLHWHTWAGLHRHGDLGTTWSSRVRVEMQRGSWSGHAQAGRGVSFAGSGEVQDETGTRPGISVSGGLERRGLRTRWSVIGYHKHLENSSTAARLFFPELGGGPEDISGLLGTAAWRLTGTRSAFGLEASCAWTPWVDGDRGGRR
ncbi:MAG: TonB-dependent receptor [Candidatus Krumholzibacteriia bacterium]